MSRKSGDDQGLEAKLDDLSNLFLKIVQGLEAKFDALKAEQDAKFDALSTTVARLDKQCNKQDDDDIESNDDQVEDEELDATNVKQS